MPHLPGSTLARRSRGLRLPDQDVNSEYPFPGARGLRAAARAAVCPGPAVAVSAAGAYSGVFTCAASCYTLHSLSPFKTPRFSTSFRFAFFLLLFRNPAAFFPAPQAYIASPDLFNFSGLIMVVFFF